MVSRVKIELFLMLLILSMPMAAFARTPVLRIDSGGHMSVVWKVLFTRDGRQVVSAGEDKVIRVWDIESGRTVRTILGEIGAGQEGKYFALALSPDDRWLAAGGYFPPNPQSGANGLGDIRLYDFNSGEIESLLTGHANVVTALAFSADGRFLASGGADGAVRVWKLDPEPSPWLVLTGHEGVVSAVAFSPDARMVVSAGHDSDLRLWRLEDGSLEKRMTGHQGQVWTLAYDPKGRYILSAGYADKRLKLWDGRSGAFIKDLAVLEQGPPGLAVSPDGTRVAAGAQEGPGSFACPVYSVPGGEKLAVFSGHHNSVKAVAVSPDGKLAASGGGSGNEIFVWSLDTGRPVQKMAGQGSPVYSVGLSARADEIAWGDMVLNPTWLKFGPLKHSMILADGGEWNAAPGREIDDESRFAGARHRQGPYSLKVSPQGPHGWYTLLEVMEEGKIVSRIKAEPSAGTIHRCFTFTPDGQTVIIGGNNGFLAAYDAASGRMLTELAGHESEVWGLAVSGDGGLLVSGSNDQTFRLWSLKDIGQRRTIEPLLSFFTAADREWVAWTPKGYYTGSLKGDRYIGWHVNQGPGRKAEFFPAARFSARFFRPDVVGAVLEARDLDLGLERAGRKRNTETKVEVAKLLPPVVFFIQPEARYLETVESELKIRAAGRPISGEPVTDLKLYVNGRPVDEKDLTVENGGEGLEKRLEGRVRLDPGENDLILIGENRLTRSNPETIKVVCRAPKKDLPKPTLYLLSVGVSRYSRPEINLNLAHSDARAVARILAGQQGKLYGRVETRVLIDDRAARGDILDGLDWLIREATQHDVAVLFLAGHGVDDGRGGYYFLGHDVDPERIRRTGVEWFHFKDALTAVSSKMILWADTCHSGHITGSRRTRGARDMTGALKELVEAGPGVVVMTAATGREASMESDDWGHGAFTKSLVEGLGGRADYDRNGLVEIKEIDLFVTQRVKELTNGGQHPATEIPASMPNFPVAAVD